LSLFNELKRRNVLRVGAAYIVVAWLAIQVVETVFPAFGFGDSAIRVVTIAFAIGLIPTLVLAWVFEITPEGLKWDSEVDRSQSISPGSGKKLDRIIMVVLALSLGYFAFDKFVLDPARDAAELESAREEGRTEATIEAHGAKSIAVIPFLNLSSDPEQAYFADGVAEEVLNLLAKIPELRVISRSSSFTFRGDDIEIPEIAKRLNVAHILEGSVRKSGDRIRVTAQLIEARSDTHLWSETYDRTLDDIFAIQDEIARHIVENLQLELVNPMPVSRRTDPVALALTIQAQQIFYRYYVSGQPPGSGDRMAALLDRALGLDPQYAPALAWYGYANWLRMEEGLISREEGQRRFDEIAERTLAIDPESAMILQQQAWQELFININPEAAARKYEKALRSAPNNSEVLRQIGRFEYIIGRYDDSFASLERSVELDPLCTMCLYHLSRAYMVAGEFDKAEEVRGRFLLIGGSGGNYHYGVIKLLQGDAKAALGIFEESIEINVAPALAGRAMAFHTLGRHEEADAALADLIRIGEDGDRVSTAYEPGLEATVFAWRGDGNSAFEWLDKALDDSYDPGAKSRRDISRLNDPLFRSLHSDPRWEAFRERTGLPTKRIEALKFSVELPE
jgi:TolB-like protein/tetratricopeptide (TPR) repeat protein